MNEETARNIIGLDYIRADNSIYNGGQYTAWSPDSPDITLDGQFTAEDLEALAWWMRNKGTK